MLKINILQDEELQEILNRFTSALLPHSSYDASMFTTILNTVLRYIHLNEMEMEYKVLYGLFAQLSKIKAHFGDQYDPCLSRESLNNYLSLNISEILTDPFLGIKDWLEYEGMNSNLQIEDAKFAAGGKLIERTLMLYDTCLELGVGSKEILNEEPTLKAAFLTNCSSVCMNMQRQVLMEGKKIGRKFYKESNGWLEYTSYSIMEIQQRMNELVSDNIVTLDDIGKAYDLLKELRSTRIPIAKYGIPEIDGDFDMETVADSSTDPNVKTPILRHRLVVVVGKENIGKTHFAIDQAVNVMIEGRKVVYMCGESNKSTVMCKIIINYLYKTEGIVVRPGDIAGVNDVVESVQIKINAAIKTIIDGGLLTLTSAFNYATVYSELQSLYDDIAFDMCIIDHSCALIGTVGDGSVKSKIDALSDACKRFRYDYPVCIVVTSHPSTVAKGMDNKGDNIIDSPTKGSQNLSTDADEVFVLRSDAMSRAEGTLYLENTKRRDAARITTWIKLQTKFEVSAFIYKKELQVMKVDTENTTEVQEKLAQTGNVYDSEESLEEDA